MRHDPQATGNPKCRLGWFVCDRSSNQLVDPRQLRDNSEMQDRQVGWCEEGPSMAFASRQADLDEYKQCRSTFANAPPEEARAAKYLHYFTGNMPEPRDAGELNGAADILLRPAAGGIEVVEVTSALDQEHQKNFYLNEQLEAMVGDLYAGANAWRLHLTKGWKAPRNRKEIAQLADRIARELESLDQDGKPHEAPERIESASWIRARLEDEAPSVQIASWNSNIPEADETNGTYLTVLSDYLESSPLIRDKIRKINREAEILSASRRHLYLFVTPTGKFGSLFPPSPGHLTDGVFAPPRHLTDLWIDGRGRFLYHWSSLTGWRFHRLQGLAPGENNGDSSTS